MDLLQLGHMHMTIALSINTSPSPHCQSHLSIGRDMNSVSLPRPSVLLLNHRSFCWCQRKQRAQFGSGKISTRDCKKVEQGTTYRAVNLEKSSSTIFSGVTLPVMSWKAGSARGSNPSYTRKYWGCIIGHWQPYKLSQVVGGLG